MDIPPLPSKKSHMRDLIVICHLRWDFVFQRPQHVLTRLARHYRVTVVEEPLWAEGPSTLQVTSPAPNLSVVRPLTRHRSAGFSDEQLQEIGPLLADHVRERKIVDPIVWFYTPMAVELLACLQPGAVVYDCMDELSAFRHAPPELLSREARLLEQTDIVFTGGPSLYQAKRDRHARVYCLPSAVDAAHYAPTSGRAAASGALQHHIPHPRLGFFGVVDERLDLDLIRTLALAEPGWQLVMVGPVVKISNDTLPRLPNIHWFGQQAYADLPGIVAGWDVCLLPFALNESTRFISPTKTLEYMAAQKPIVSTPIRDVSALFGHALRVEAAGPGFVQACRDALAETPATRDERIRLTSRTVAEYSWDTTAERMADAIEQVIKAKRLP